MVVDYLQQVVVVVVIFFVGFEVVGQQFDVGGQQGNLDFWGVGVSGVVFVVFNDFLGVD